MTVPATGATQTPDRVPLHFHVLRAGEYDHAAMLAKLTTSNPRKQVFQSVSPLVIVPGVASVYLHMQNSMNAFEFSMPSGGHLDTLAIFTGPSITFALNDAMWKKYGIGDALKLAPTNIYYHATSSLNASASPDDPNGLYQDWSAQAVLHRGGALMVCHNAMTAVAGLFAMKSGSSPAAVLADFKKNVLPGFQIVPAGVAATQLAQQHGWCIYPVI